MKAPIGSQCKKAAQQYEQQRLRGIDRLSVDLTGHDRPSTD